MSVRRSTGVLGAGDDPAVASTRDEPSTGPRARPAPPSADSCSRRRRLRIDGSGVVRKIYSYSKDQAVSQVNVAVGDLPTGTYFVRVQVGTYHEVKKLIKL